MKIIREIPPSIVFIKNVLQNQRRVNMKLSKIMCIRVSNDTYKKMLEGSVKEKVGLSKLCRQAITLYVDKGQQPSVSKM